MIQRLAQFWASKTRMTSGRWRWLGYLLTIAAVLYLIYTLTRGNLRLDQLDWGNYGTAILATLGLYLVSLLIQFFIWTRLIAFHRKVSWQDAEIYARMVLMRSLPGGAWHWVGRISMYSGTTEVPVRVVVLGNFLEWALLILVGAAVTLALTGSPALRVLTAGPALGAAVGLAVTWQPALRSWPEKLAESGLWVALDIGVWLAGAAILYLFVHAIGGEMLSLPEALRIWALSGSLSMLIIFLPSSLGIREVSLVWLLQPYLDTSLALLVALLIRVVFILADILWGLAGWIFSQIVLKRSPNKFQT